MAANRLYNVELKPDASREDVSQLLGRAKIFLHTKRGEHFGISTVEAIGKGCLPMVHDSGGGRETVPMDTLRFETKLDAEQKIETLLSDYQARQPTLMARLRDNAGQFGYETFAKKMGCFIFDRMGRISFTKQLKAHPELKQAQTASKYSGKVKVR